MLLCRDYQGTLDILTEATHIKHALSRIVVEIAKREWPQEWPLMIEELNSIYSQGVCYTDVLSEKVSKNINSGVWNKKNHCMGTTGLGKGRTEETNLRHFVAIRMFLYAAECSKAGNKLGSDQKSSITYRSRWVLQITNDGDDDNGAK